MASKYKEIWKNLLKVKKLPNRCSGIVEISYEKFKFLSDKFNHDIATEFVSNLLDGKVFIIKKAFSEDFVQEIKSKIKKPNKELVEKIASYFRVGEAEGSSYIDVMDKSDILSLLEGIGIEGKEAKKLLK